MENFDYELKDGTVVNPLSDVILVYGMEHGETVLSSGIIIPDDNGKATGIRPRTCKIYSVGDNIDYLKPEDKILVSHGRWSRGFRVKEKDGTIKVIRRVDPKDILLVFS